VIARKHHYLPQCYLKTFATTRKKSKQVQVFDRKLKRNFAASIADVAAERDFNTVNLEGHPPDAIEKGMAEFESELAPALQRIIEMQSLPDNQDRIYLLNLIGLAAIRNPDHRETYRDFHERLATSIMSLATSTPEIWESQMRGAKKAGYVPVDADTDYERMKDFISRGEYTVELPTERHMIAEMEGLDAILPHLVKRKWMLVKAPQDSPGFVTSDRPVCLIWSEKKRRPIGFGLKGTEVVFPVSNRLVVMGAFELEDSDITINERQVAELNGLFVAYSRRQVYARDLNFLYTPRFGHEPQKGSRLIKDRAFLQIDQHNDSVEVDER
jgi:hypothetical protein